MTATKHRATLRTVAQFVAGRQDFDCNQSLSGRTGYAALYVGQLPRQFQAKFDGDRYAADFYVVRSYQTPIAWFANGQWFMPDTKYSVTTSRHMGAIGVRTIATLL